MGKRERRSEEWGQAIGKECNACGRRRIHSCSIRGWNILRVRMRKQFWLCLKSIFLPPFVLVLFTVQPMFAQVAGDLLCPIHKGTYVKRQLLEERWARHDLSESEAIRQLRVLDIEYSHFQQQASGVHSNNPERLKSLCSACSPDPIAGFECAVLLFRTYPGQYRNALLSSITATKEGVRPLGIAQFPVTPLKIAQSFRPGGPAYAYLRSLLKLAANRDREAFTKLLSITPYLEGELGEWNSDAVAKMWVTHPDIFQSHWASVKNHPEALGTIKAVLSEEQSKYLINDAEKNCRATREVCKDIVREIRK